MNSIRNKYKVILLFILLLIFRNEIVYSEDYENKIVKEIVSIIQEDNRKIQSYKIRYTTLKKNKSDNKIQKGKGNILFDRSLEKIKDIFVNVNTQNKFISIYNGKKRKYISYVPHNDICNMVNIKKLEKAVQSKVPLGHFITTIHKPFSKLNMKNIKYQSVENIGLTWAYHLKYDNMDLWVGTKDGLLYKKKMVNNEREVIFTIEKIEKNVGINPAQFIVEFPNEVKKVNITEKWINLFIKK